MVAAGNLHTVLLRSDGKVVACGANREGQCIIPALDDGLTYTQASAGSEHTILLRSDGLAVAFGDNEFGQCDIPPLIDGIEYTQVSAADFHNVLLRSDGSAVACGENTYGQCNIPPLKDQISYTQIFAGGSHSVCLQSDGRAVACGLNRQGQCDIPPLGEGMSYTQVSAGATHTFLLRSDGKAVACGSGSHKECNFPPLDLPPLDGGIRYTQMSGGGGHSVLLRSDGAAVALGLNIDGQCSIPPLDAGVKYSQVSAGGCEKRNNQKWQCLIYLYREHDDSQVDVSGCVVFYHCFCTKTAGGHHTVLLRSDGTAVACGWNNYGQCSIPSPGAGIYYMCCMNLGADLVLQLEVASGGDDVTLVCSDLAGKKVLRLNAGGSDLCWETHKRILAWLKVFFFPIIMIISRRLENLGILICLIYIYIYMMSGFDGPLKSIEQKFNAHSGGIAREMKINLQRLRIVLPDGQLLAHFCRANPEATMATVATMAVGGKRQRLA